MEDNKDLLKERAEDYTSKQIGKIDTFDKHLVKNLEGYLFSSAGKERPCLLLGGKGTGKTLNLIKTLRRGVRELSDFFPVMFIYEKGKKMEQISPSLFLSEEIDENRLNNMENLSQNEALEEADVVVFDDFHYICEDIERGQYSPENLIAFLEKIVEQVEDGKRVIISSADQLSAYSDVVEDQRFDEIILRYGEGKGSKDSLARMEVSSPTVKEWNEIAECLGVKGEGVILRFVYECNPKPRKLVRFANLFDGKITREKLCQKAAERLEKIVRDKYQRNTFSRDFFKVLFEFPSLSSKFGEMLDTEVDEWNQGTLEDLEFMKEKNQLIAKEIADDLEMPELEKVDKKKWTQNPIYTVSKKYNEGPLGKKVVKEKLDEILGNQYYSVKNRLKMVLKNHDCYEMDGVLRRFRFPYMENTDVSERKKLQRVLRVLRKEGVKTEKIENIARDAKIALADRNEIISFFEDTDRYLKFLENLKEVKEGAGEHFDRILGNFNQLFQRTGSEWFPIEPSRAAFHELLYDSQPKDFEFLPARHRKSVHEFMDRVIPKFNLPRNVKEEAHKMFKKFCSLKDFGGYSARVFALATICLACRKNSLSRSIKDFTENVPDSTVRKSKNPTASKMARIYKAYKKVRDELNIDISPSDSTDYAVRIGEGLGLERDTVEEAVEIVERAKKKMNLSGRSPISIAAGAIYIAAVRCGERKSQKEVGEVANVTEVTVRNNYKLIAEGIDLSG